jgi:hypothetical protein
MKKMLLLLVLALSFRVISAQLPDPVQLMEKSRDLTLMGAIKSDITLTIYEKNGSTRVRKINMIAKTYGGTEKRIIKFLEPADVRGTGLLIVDNDEGQDEMWIYLPALKRTRRIVTTEKGKSFMSSEFSNADMSSAPLSDFKITHMSASGQNGEWVIQSQTINEEKADEYGYNRKITYLDKSDLKIKKIEFFNYENVMQRTIDILSSQPVAGKEGYIMTEMFVNNHINGRSSRIKYDAINTSVPIPDNMFVVENLER